MLIEKIIKDLEIHSLYIKNSKYFKKILDDISSIERKYNYRKYGIYLEVDYDFISENYDFFEKLNRQIIFVINFENKLSDDLEESNIDILIKFQKIINIISSLKYPMHFRNIDENQMEYFYKNNFKGGIYDFKKYSFKKLNNLINNCYKLSYPSEYLFKDSLNILDLALHKEGKYINKDNKLIKNDNICGAFKIKINHNLDNINEDILIDKASILIYKKILSRYFFLKMNEKKLYFSSYNVEFSQDGDISTIINRENNYLQDKYKNDTNNKKDYVINKEMDLKIIKIGFNHVSLDNVPIDFTEWNILSYQNIFTVIKIINLVTGEICNGKYFDDRELFIYNIILYEEKKTDIDFCNISNFEGIEFSEKEIDYCSIFSDKIQNIFPCNNEKFINFSLNNDFNHILDLEDSVSYFEKSKARDNLVRLFSNFDFLKKIKNKSIWIRINSINSTESIKDISEVISKKYVLENIKGIILPKVNYFEEVQNFFSILSTIEQNIWEKDNSFKRGRLLIQILIESCEGLYNIDKISENNGISSFISGLYDYKNSVGSWDIFNQYPSLIYQKKKIIDVCKKQKIISIESITPVLDFNKAFTESLISYNINFVSKWSVYPNHIKGSNYSKDLTLFFNNGEDIINNLKLLLKNLKILKFYKKIDNLDEITERIEKYIVCKVKKEKDLNIIISMISLLNKNSTEKYNFSSYFVKDNKFYDKKIFEQKLRDNEAIVCKAYKDNRNLLKYIEPVSLEIQLKDIDKIQNIDCSKIDNFIVKIEPDDNIDKLLFIKDKKITIIV